MVCIVFSIVFTGFNRAALPGGMFVLFVWFVCLFGSQTVDELN
jgi:hypothetical protein